MAVVVLPGAVSCRGWQGQVKVNHGQIVHSNLEGKEEKSVPCTWGMEGHSEKLRASSQYFQV